MWKYACLINRNRLCKLSCWLEVQQIKLLRYYLQNQFNFFFVAEQKNASVSDQCYCLSNCSSLILSFPPFSQIHLKFSPCPLSPRVLPHSDKTEISRRGREEERGGKRGGFEPESFRPLVSLAVWWDGHGGGSEEGRNGLITVVAALGKACG